MTRYWLKEPVVVEAYHRPAHVTKDGIALPSEWFVYGVGLHREILTDEEFERKYELMQDAEDASQEETGI